MKRSEMIHLIAGLLSTHTLLEKDHPSVYIGFAAEILCLVEKQGMLPPDPEIKSYYVFDEEVHDIIADWEPEDERTEES